MTYFYSSHSSTGQSPHAVLFGQEPRLPVDDFLGNLRPPRTLGEDLLKQHLERLNALRNRVADKAKKTYEAREPATPRGMTLKVGDQVLLRQHPPGRCKLFDRYGETPATILKVPSDEHGSFTIGFQDSSRVTGVS